jgi:hypothetical protein
MAASGWISSASIDHLSRAHVRKYRDNKPLGVYPVVAAGVRGRGVVEEGKQNELDVPE